MADYRLSPLAEHDLGNIWRLTRDVWGIDQADRYYDTLVAKFSELAASPLSAAGCDHIRPGYRRWRAERHVIYFRATAYGIAVIRILHDRMDPKRHL